MVITVASGKGGRGKTSLAASFAALSENQILADNDVDTADLHLLLTPKVREVHPFAGGIKARVEPENCIGCGRCARVCPVNTIRTSETITGHWYVSETTYNPMIHARLGIAEDNSGRLVTQVRNRAAELAVELHAGQTTIQYGESAAATAVKAAWKEVQSALKGVG